MAAPEQSAGVLYSHIAGHGYRGHYPDVYQMLIHIKIRKSAVSQHLRVLRVVGLVKAERRGYRIRYFMNLEALDRYRNVLSDVLRKAT